MVPPISFYDAGHVGASAARGRSASDLMRGGEMDVKDGFYAYPLEMGLKSDMVIVSGTNHESDMETDMDIVSSTNHDSDMDIDPSESQGRSRL